MGQIDLSQLPDAPRQIDLSQLPDADESTEPKQINLSQLPDEPESTERTWGQVLTEPIVPSLRGPSFEQQQEDWLAGGMQGPRPEFNLVREVGRETLNPLALGGELLGGAGLIKGLRNLRRTGNILGKTAEAPKSRVNFFEPILDTAGEQSDLFRTNQNVARVKQPELFKIPDEILNAPKVNETVSQAVQKKPGMAGMIYDEVGNFMRATMTAWDLSPVGRQGRNLVTYPAYWKSLPSLFKSLGNEEGYRIVMGTIEELPTQRRIYNGRSLAEIAGLDTTDLLNHREEIFASRIAERYIPGVRASERAYLGYLNTLRAKQFENMAQLAMRNGTDLTKNHEYARHLGDFVNNATGRGSLGSLENNAKLLSRIFFAPRLHAGRIRMWERAFNPFTYSKLPKEIRLQYMRSLFSTALMGYTFGEIARLGGAEVSNDPTNTDFRKVKFGDTRIDPFPGDQQYAVLIAKLLSGKSTSSTSGNVTDLWEGGFGSESTLSVGWRFAKNRMAPLPKAFFDIFGNERYNNESIPEHIRNTAIQSVVPLAVQDAYELLQEDPELAPFLAPAVFGYAGIQNYGR